MHFYSEKLLVARNWDGTVTYPVLAINSSWVLKVYSWDQSYWNISGISKVRQSYENWK